MLNGEYQIWFFWLDVLPIYMTIKNIIATKCHTTYPYVTTLLFYCSRLKRNLFECIIHPCTMFFTKNIPMSCTKVPAKNISNSWTVCCGKISLILRKIPLRIKMLIFNNLCTVWYHDKKTNLYLLVCKNWNFSRSRAFCKIRFVHKWLTSYTALLRKSFID